jgi:hypothetical protein
MKLSGNVMAAPKRQTGNEQQQTGKAAQSSVTVVRINRSELARNPFRYVSDPPQMTKERTGEADE